MSNFENEYKNYAKESTPDLWDRIEAGVDAYEASQSSANNQSNENQSNIVSFNKEESEVKVTPSKKNWKKYSGLIVAAAAVIIVAPAIILMSDGGLSKVDSAPTAMDAQPMMSETAAEEAAEPSYEDSESVNAATEDVAEEETATTDEAPAQEAAPVCEAPAESAEVSDEAEDVSAESEEEENAIADANEARKEVQAFKGTTNAEKAGYPFSAQWVDEKQTTFDCPVIVVDEGEPGTRIRLSFDDNIYDFEILNIQVTDVTDDGDLVYDSESVYKQKSVEAGEEMILQMSFPGDIPNHAIKYKDSDGNEAVLSIYESGYDGSVSFSEM